MRRFLRGPAPCRDFDDARIVDSPQLVIEVGRFARGDAFTIADAVAPRGAQNRWHLPLVFCSVRRFCDVIHIPFVLIKLRLLWFFVQTITARILYRRKCRRLSTLRHVCHVGGKKQRYASMKRSCFTPMAFAFDNDSPSCLPGCVDRE